MSEVECMAKRQVLPESAGLCNCAELEQARAQLAEEKAESEYWGGMAIDNGKLLVTAEAAMRAALDKLAATPYDEPPCDDPGAPNQTE